MKKTRKPWNTLNAAEWLNPLLEPCREAGYILAMYGSVAVVGVGHDLDIFAIPMDRTASERRLSLAIVKNSPTEWTTCHSASDAAHGRRNLVFCYSPTCSSLDRRAIDIIVLPYRTDSH